MNLQTTVLHIGCVYRSPNSPSSFFPLLIRSSEYLSLLPSGTKLIAGDFNLPHICWPTLSAPPNLMDLITSIHLGGWTQHVVEPTRNGNILDLVFTHNMPLIDVTVTRNFPGSDHKMVICHLPLSGPPNPAHTSNNTLLCRNWALLVTLIRQKDWGDYFLTQDPQHAADIFYSFFSDCLEKLSHTAQAGPKKRSPVSPLHKKYHKLLKQLHNSNDFSLFIRLNRLSTLIQRQDNTLPRDQEAKALSHPNKSQLLSMLHKSRNADVKADFQLLILDNNSSITSPPCIAEAFSAFFASAMAPATVIAPPSSSPLTDSVLSTISFDARSIS